MFGPENRTVLVAEAMIPNLPKLHWVDADTRSEGKCKEQPASLSPTGRSALEGKDLGISVAC